MKTPILPTFNRRLLGLTLGLTLLAVPAALAQTTTVYGLAQGGTTLIALPSNGTGTPTLLPISGIAGGQTLVGLDSRPATGQLFALGYNGSGTAQLYTINATTGAATAVGSTVALALGASTERIGFDFNPTVDRIRVTSSNLANFRLNPNNGALAATDTNLNGAPGAVIDAVAYTNSFIGAATTVLYDVDVANSRLYIQTNPNGGVLGSPVPITRNSLPLLTGTEVTDLDIYTDPASGTQQAILSVVSGVSTTFYSLDLTTGNASLLLNGTPGVLVSDIAFGIDRTTPAVSGQLLYAVSTNANLLSFYSGTPGFINSAVAITGLTAGQTLVGTDFRPNTGELFGMGYNPANGETRLYVINLSTAVATPVGPAAVTLDLGNSVEAVNGVGFDFNPTVDRIRVTGLNARNYRLNPNNGAIAAPDGNLNFVSGATGTPTIGSVAYTNSFPGSTSTVLYDVDDVRNQLFIQSNPNAGQLTSASGATLLPGTGGVSDLDFYYDAAAQVNRGFLVSNAESNTTTATFSSLYSLDVTAGTTTAVGRIGLGIPVRDVAAVLTGANASAALTGQLLYGVAGGNLVSFDSGNPGVIRTAVNITGLAATQVLVGTDFRPATGELFALGYDATNQQGQLYILNLSTGALTAVGSAGSLPLGPTASAIGFDFNPTVDRIRITSAANQANLRMNPADGTYITDTALTNPNGTPAMSAAAYTNNDNNANTGTTLYGYDQARNVLLRSTNANAGTYVDQGSTGLTVNPGVDFDVFSDVSNPSAPANSAFLVASPTGSTADNLYTVDLNSGGTSLVGRIGNGSNLTGLAAFLTPAPVIAAGLTWTGAVSTDWNNAGNWSPAQVPTATDNVTIPNVANDPVVGFSFANNVTLLNGAQLTFGPGSILQVSGDFTNNGGTTTGTGFGEIRFVSSSATQRVSGTASVFNILTTNNSTLQLDAPVQVQRSLNVTGAVVSNGNLTLLSTADRTAQVLNTGSNTIFGNVTVQRYIDPSLNAGAGYRHFSSPVSNTTVADLTTTNFTPVVNPAYNSAPNPGAVTPFPTVFGYDQSRVTTSGNPAPQDFDKGFFSPSALSDAMTPGRGYTVNIPAGLTTDFVGILNNGTINVGGLGRGTQAESGWQLLGNPYPSPIDWDQVGRTNVDNAVYVFRSNGQYSGSYSSYVNGVGNNGGTNVIGLGQGFFTRVTTPGSTNGQVSFTNAARLLTVDSPVFQRTQENRPLAQLELRAATGGPGDQTTVYFETGATAAFDVAFDAAKRQTATATLASQAGNEKLAINGLPVLTTADVTVPLLVTAPTAGSYTLQAAQLLNLPVGTLVYLRDAQTGTVVDLVAQPSYSFTLTPGAGTGRFSLLFTQQRVLANAPAALSRQVEVFPNPARDVASVSLTAAFNRQAVEASVVNSLGQVVRRVVLPAGAEVRTLPLNGVTPGVYMVRLQTNQGTINKRLVIE